MAGSAGNNGCGTFAVASSGSNANSTNGLEALASNLATAINACTVTTFGATVATAPTTNSLTITDAYPGNAVNTFTVTSSDTTPFSVGSITQGSPGSAACSGSHPTFTGSFVNGTTGPATALNYYSAIGGSGCSTVGVTATSPGSGNSVPISDNVLGVDSFSVSNVSNNNVAWTGTVLGTNGGPNACAGASPTFTATYATSSSTATVASNMSAAIHACTSSGLTASYSSGSTFTVTDGTAGTGGNGQGALSPTSGAYFYFHGAALGTNGSDGTTSGTTFAYWYQKRHHPSPQLAHNIAAAINDNATRAFPPSRVPAV